MISLGAIVSNEGLGALRMAQPVPPLLLAGSELHCCGPSSERMAIGYVVGAAGCVLYVSPAIGYGHGGERGTPCTWAVGDYLQVHP